MVDMRAFLLLSLLLLTAVPAGAADLPVLSDAWVRAMPPGQRMTAAYVRVTNPGDVPLTILEVSTDRGMASLHETRMEEGSSRMRPVDFLAVPAQGTLALEPGGLHVMIMGLLETPREGESLSLCLRTADGEACTEAPVQRAAPASVHGNHNH